MKPLISIVADLDMPRISINHLLKQHNVSRAFRNRLKNEGFCKINNIDVRWNHPLIKGDRLDVFLPIDNSEFSRYKLDLEIIYEDEYFIVINKPSGLLMHPTSTERNNTLANALLYYYDKTNQEVEFHPIHRLDKDTSGIVIVAKSPLVQHAFHQQNSPIVKTYTTFVSGFFPIEHSTIHFPIARKEGSIIERNVSTQGSTAHTDITRLMANEKASILRIVLHTGRTHQIRVHCSSLGYPLLGDDLYGGPTELITRQALHASELSFYHPMTNKPLKIVAPLPNDLKMLKNNLFN